MSLKLFICENVCMVGERLGYCEFTEYSSLTFTEKKQKKHTDRTLGANTPASVAQSQYENTTIQIYRQFHLKN